MQAFTSLARLGLVYSQLMLLNSVQLSKIARLLDNHRSSRLPGKTLVKLSTPILHKLLSPTHNINTPLKLLHCLSLSTLNRVSGFYFLSNKVKSLQIHQPQ
ncbi:hypothetical protein PGTUg99_021242 [Puccinia graminis f. sp. tritici]|uniref:Uncharacterized protein n=1 Tax=Puccinia graminis f. sp. tritici TaxID=56615 RepID=A0A5B0P0H1_PUCGR|nr:hypothetical protein PGTUg99_021242 [Puccinia graminis f. sp. tritici]